MKTTFFFVFSFIFSLLLVSCSNSEEQGDVPKSKENSDDVEYVENLENSDTIPPVKIGNGVDFSFKFIRIMDPKEDNLLSSIIVYNKQNLHQKLEVNESDYYNQYKLIDCNFDGFKDIMVLINSGSGGSTYLVWNYDIQTGIYKYNSDLSNVFGLGIDSKNKNVVFRTRGGWQEEGAIYHKYDNGKLVAFKTVEIYRWEDRFGQIWERKKEERIIDEKIYTNIDTSRYIE